MTRSNADYNNCDYQQDLMPIDEALDLLQQKANPLQETELIDLVDANGRVLAESIVSTINVPPHDNSAMDGYAVRYGDFDKQDNQPFEISQRICAGDIGAPLKARAVARIFTGAPIPEGADTVIMQERCIVSNGTMTSGKLIKKGSNIRRAGEDIAIGDTLLCAGHQLKPQDMGLIASVGIGSVPVYRRLRVGIFFTGDELQEPDTILGAGKIYNANRYILRGLLENLNCDIVDLGIIEDSLEATQQAMLNAAEQTDLVMTSGGVSVGEEDYVRVALELLGQLEMWRINIKPGKPFTFGRVGYTPFLGLPGNPVSVFATFALFARPYILAKQNSNNAQAQFFQIAANFNWDKKGTRCEYLRVRLIKDQSGKETLNLYPHQGSGVLSSVSWANGLVMIPPETTVQKGDKVDYIPFSELSAG